MKQLSASQNVFAFAVGFLFAAGLAIAGMTQPQKIIGFLSIDNWDPALIFVMVGAIGVHIFSYPFAKKKASPLLDTRWHIPTRKDLTSRLVIGSALFGIGWGLGGFCPGPGLASIGTGDLRAILFVAAMLAGMFIFKKTERFLKLKE